MKGRLMLLAVGSVGFAGLLASQVDAQVDTLQVIVSSTNGTGGGSIGDATTLLPGLTGFRGKFSAGYSVASSRSPFFPHKGPGRRRYVNKIFLDGHYDRQYNQ